MKRAHAILAVTMAVSTASLGFTPEAVCAQRPGGGGGRMMQVNSVEFLVSECDALGLSNEQEESLKAIAADLAVEMEPIREEMMSARGGGREAMMAVREKMTVADEKAVGLAMEVLDDSQKETAKKLLADRPRRRGPGGG